MDIQAIIARIEAIAASGVEEVEKVIHDALDTIEQVLGLDDSAGDAGNGASVTNATSENAPTTPDAATDTVTPAAEVASGDTPAA